MLTTAIGDIHGMADLLDRLLARIDAWRAAHYPEEDHQLIFLGDYIDRGPDSLGVLDRVRTLQDQGAICLRGNHEQLMIDALNSELGMSRFLASGGYATIRSLQTTGALLEAIDWAQSLPLTHEDNLRVFVHAGLRPGLPLAEQSEDDLLWIRRPFLDHEDPFPKYIVHGHTPTFLQPGQSRRPDIRQNRCNLDTGAVYGGPLTAAIFSDATALPVAIIGTDEC